MAKSEENLLAFSQWLRKNKIVSLISGTGVLAVVEIVAKWVHFEGFTLSPQYLLPVVVGLLFLCGLLFCIWIAGNPQIESPDQRSSERFSRRTQRLAKFGIAPMLALGAAGIFVTLPKPRVPVTELKALLAAVDRQAVKLRSSGNTYKTYLAYQNARKNDPTGFWEDTDVWETVATLDQDNPKLKAAIESNVKFVNQNLAAWQATGRVHGLQLEDVAAVIGRYAQADALHAKIQDFKPQTYQDQKDFNETLCTYWDFFLIDDPAEDRVREWLKEPRKSK